MEHDRSFISDPLGGKVFAALLGLSTIFFGAWHFTNEEAPSTAAPDLVAELKESHLERRTLQKELEKVSKERSRLISELDASKAEFIVTAEKLDAAQEQLSLVSANLAKAEMKVKTLTRSMEQVMTEASEESETTRSALVALEQKAAADARAWAEAREDLETQLADASMRLAKAPSRGAEIDALKTRIVSLEQKLDILGNQRNEMARSLRFATSR
ncbi:MAG: hypothetical protein KDN20_25065 [Verrucomicrobiae bacterium]|nr:hypothetical protein [Verrucomicrobiae bacterium]